MAVASVLTFENTPLHPTATNPCHQVLHLPHDLIPIISLQAAQEDGHDAPVSVQYKLGKTVETIA
jgi:hypothetical protein